MRYIISCFAFLFIFSCNLEERNHTPQIKQMEDSLFKTFPSVNRVSIEVKDDFGTEVNITLGDAELYSASEDERMKVVSKASKLTENIFAEDKPGKGSVIFVKEENTIDVKEETKKIYPMALPKN
jgi:hypothetical protein